MKHKKQGMGILVGVGLGVFALLGVFGTSASVSRRLLSGTGFAQGGTSDRGAGADTGTANPVPLINQPLVPDATAPGGAGFTLTANGTGFVPGSVVNWNGSARATTFLNSSQLTAAILASDIATASTASVSVVSPSPGGGMSEVVFFPITNPTFSLTLNRSDFAAGSGSNFPGTADFNGDGRLDLAVPKRLANTVSVLLGNGVGTFQAQVAYNTGTSPGGLTIADLRQDGISDLVVANEGDNTISVLLGNGDGTFASKVDYNTGIIPVTIAVGDFNGDGKLDLAVAAYNCPNQPCAPGTVSILLGNGDGTFQTHADYVTGPGAIAIGAGDFNGDGKLDLAVTAGNGGIGNQVSVLLGNGDGTFQDPVNYTVGLNPGGVAIADFNKDGKLDLAVVNNAGSVSILLGNGDGTFQRHVDYATGPFPNLDVGVADFTGDGNLDLAIANKGSNTVSLLLGKGDGTFQPQVQFGTGSTPFGVTTGDFNEDGRLDLAVGDQGAGTVSVLLQGTTVALSTASLKFGVQLVGAASGAQTVTVTNTGAIALTISSIAASGDFLQTNNCGTSLAAGASCTIDVSFKPTAKGTRAGTLTITDNAANSPQTVALAGTGTVVQLSPALVDFGNQKVGTTSPPHTITLTNTGSTPLSIQAIAIGGTDFGDFAYTTTCSSSLPSKASCTVNVTFTPMATGTRRASLKVQDDGGGSPQRVRLTGTGT